MISLDQIRRDLRFLSSYEVVLYGSYVTGDYTREFDIYMAVITREKDKNKNFRIQLDIWGKVPSPIYDMRVFELLPIRVKASVIDGYLVLFGSESDISEYFYRWRKVWEDVRRRIEPMSIEEKIKAVRRRKKILKTITKPE